MTLENEWQGFASETFGPGTSDEALRMAKAAMYVGAAYPMGILNRAMDDPAQTREVFQELEALRVELQQYMRELHDRPPGDQG